MLTEACCYDADIHPGDSGCSVGRPYFDGGAMLSAPLCSTESSALGSDVDRTRARAWASAGAAEHASVAAFSRLALELLRFGAPLELLREVQQAALEEIAHAEACWKLAEHFGAGKVSAGPFPFPPAIALTSDLAELAAACVREGCLAETLGAHVTAVAAELAPEREVRGALERIAADESRHAVLSFRIVAWSLRVGSSAVREAVTAAFAAPRPTLNIGELALRSGVDAALLDAAAQTGMSDVIEPARRELLAA